VFGLSFGELCVLIIVAIVVIGPKDMPRVLRKAGQLAGKLRRMASDVRTQSGIDEVLRADGLHEDIAEIRRLAQADFLAPVARPTTRAVSPSEAEPAAAREKEYPRDGADSYGAVPDTASLYVAASSPSPLARDPLYVTGDPSGVLPEPPPANRAATAAEDDAPAPQAAPASTGEPRPSGSVS
jgi:sec-independent protein translocase protein TatB